MIKGTNVVFESEHLKLKSDIEWWEERNELIEYYDVILSKWNSYNETWFMNWLTMILYSFVAFIWQKVANYIQTSFFYRRKFRIDLQKELMQESQSYGSTEYMI